MTGEFVVKAVVRTTLVVALVIGLFLVIYRIAAERVEVVELATVDEAGETVITRLWIVDHEGYAYIRASGESSGWYSRLHDNEQFDLSRDGLSESYTAVDRLDKAAVINTLMQEKYSWGDSFVAFFMGTRDNSIPVELHEI